MPAKVKKVTKIFLLILLLPVTSSFFKFFIEFLLQIGRITGTFVRIIMDL